MLSGWRPLSKPRVARTRDVSRCILRCLGILIRCSHAVLCSCLGTMWFRGSRSGERNDCLPSWRRFWDGGVGGPGSLLGRWVVHRWRPYRVECTGSLPTSEVKRRRARLVLGWGTAREDLRVLPAFRACIVASCGLQWSFCPSICWCTSPSSDSRSAVAQWLACWAHNPKVRGSKPRCAIWCIVQCVRFWSPYGCVICRSCGAVCCGCVFRRGVLRFRVKCKLRQERIELPTLGL